MGVSGAGLLAVLDGGVAVDRLAAVGHVVGEQRAQALDVAGNCASLSPGLDNAGRRCFRRQLATAEASGAAKFRFWPFFWADRSIPGGGRSSPALCFRQLATRNSALNQLLAISAGLSVAAWRQNVRFSGWGGVGNYLIWR
jgi:hypothetical protein